MTELMRDSLARVQQKQKKGTRTAVVPIAAVALLAILGGAVLNAKGQDTDKYSLKSPDGIAFSDFRGYEDWSTVSSARQAEVLKVIVANSAMIKAFKAGVPQNGKAFPEGSMIVKLPVVTEEGHGSDFRCGSAGRF
jgi:Cytochrome P460